MSFSELRRRLDRDYKRAVKCGLPEWAQFHATRQYSGAVYRWEESRIAIAKDVKAMLYDRAIGELFSLHLMVGMYLSYHNPKREGLKHIFNTQAKQA